MFISVLDLFKIGIGPSSSHTMGPMVAAADFRRLVQGWFAEHGTTAECHVRCTLRGSLAFTGKGHATDRAVVLGLHGYTPLALAREDVGALVEALWVEQALPLDGGMHVRFRPGPDIVFDRARPCWSTRTG